MNDDDEIVAIFRAEVEELLGALASAIDEDPERWNFETLVHIAHTFKGTSRMVGARSMEALAHLLEECLVGVVEGRVALEGPVIEVIREGCDLLESMAEDFDADRRAGIEAYRASLARFIDPRRLAAAPELPAAASGRAAADDDDDADADAVDPTAPSASADEAAVTTVRVGAEKVERLMGLASELLAVGHGLRAQRRASAQAMHAWRGVIRSQPALAQNPELEVLGRQLTELKASLSDAVRQHQRVTQEFHDGVRRLRMLRMEALTGIFSKTVRSVARATGKRARFIVEGSSTEIDRVVLDTLRDPLIHLIRNAVAHGIEEPEARARAGKLATGTVTLAARSLGASVVLEVRDDGAGIDLTRLRRRAVERGLVSALEAEVAPDDELAELIFSSGFTTSDVVGEISGRGVGLSVVRRNTESLGGEVRVESTPGSGCSIVLEVPLTRLTTRCIQVRLGEHHFMLPMTNIRSTGLITRDAVEVVDGREVVHVGARPLPLLRLERAFDFSTDGGERRPTIVAHDGVKTWALMVDEVIGQTEVVIQPLSWNLERVRGVSGVAVLDGDEVIPLLDVRGLFSVDPSALSAGRVRATSSASTRRRILVVDDSITSRTLLKNIISAAGYEVEVSVDGEQAFARLQEREFDLVVTDVEMPRLDGFELTRKIRASTPTRELPVIICTSLGSGVEKARGASAGADAYVVKGSFEQDELLSTIGRLC